MEAAAHAWLTLGSVLHADKSNRGCVTENYTPGRRNKGDIADAIRRAPLLMVDAHEVRRRATECRHQIIAPYVRPW